MKLLTAFPLTLAGTLAAVLSSAVAQNWSPTGAPNNRWYSLACSADGTKLVATVQYYPFIYASTNSGAAWFLSGAPSNSWTSVASSADGTRLVASAAVIYSPAAGGDRGDAIFTSIDSGITWQPTPAPSNQWACVASSADGSRFFAAAAYNKSNTEQGLIFLSTNSGANWFPTSAPSNRWYSVACSADGTRLAAGAIGLFTSADSGATWTSNNIPWDFPPAYGSPTWSSVASSADGATLTAIRAVGAVPRVYTSTNSGTNWSWFSLPSVGRGFVASSADGTRLLASQGHLYLSTNSGVTWAQQSIPGQTYGWGSGSVVSSADGMRLFLALGADDFSQPNTIYARFSTPRPKLNISAGAPLASNLTLSWIIPSRNFVMQEISDLTAATWVTLTNTPTLNLHNLQNQLVLSRTNASDLFRLAAP